MTQEEYRPGAKVLVAGVMVVAATYAYFLIFAQFGFLKAVQAATGKSDEAVRPLMAMLGFSGMAGSALVAWLYTTARSRRLLMAGFAMSATSAGLSLLARGMVGFHGVALLTGLGVAITTVTLAGGLRRAVGGQHLGTVIGLGTGLAYGFCNLPAVFGAPAPVQAGVAVLAAWLGLVAGTRLTLNASGDVPTGADYAPAGVLIWTMVFLALVCLDSAAFYVIQHTPGLKAGTWGGDGQLVANAGMHVVAALLAGYALDRRWMGRTVLLGAIGLFAACGLIDESYAVFAEGALLYTAAVSVYSTVLAFYPARSQRPGLAALVYAIAGWGGSGLGIALAAGREQLPVTLPVIALLVVAAGLVMRQFIRRKMQTVGTNGR